MESYPKITLEAARVNAHMTQEAAAKELGLSVRTLANYEKGVTSPTFALLGKISKLYNFPLDYIFLPDVSV